MSAKLIVTSFLFSVLAIAAEVPSKQIPLLGNTLFPESLAVDSRTGAIYVTSNSDGSIQVVENGQAKIFQVEGTDGRKEALGVKIDEKRDRLWVSGIESLYGYQLKTNKLLVKFDLKTVAKVTKPTMNDMAIDENGNVYVTESINPLLIKVDGTTLKASVYRDLSDVIPYGTQNNFPYNLNGIVIAADGKSLISVKTNDGTLWRISLVNNSVTQIKLSEAVTKGDGLVWGEGKTLYVIRNFENKVSAIDFSKGSDDAERAVTTVSPKDVSIPTSAVYLKAPAPHLLLVNSQFGQNKPTVPFTLTEVSLPLKP